MRGIIKRGLGVDIERLWKLRSKSYEVYNFF
jgi:hypothetical protein